MKVVKFGGTSIATPDHVRQVLSIIQSLQREQPLTIVVSAFGGVTNQLIRMADWAGNGNSDYLQEFQDFRERHVHMVSALTSGSRQNELLATIGRYVSRLSEILRGVFLVRHVAPKTYSQILSYGERLSARIISESLGEAGIPAEPLRMFPKDLQPQRMKR